MKLPLALIALVLLACIPAPASADFVVLVAKAGVSVDRDEKANTLTIGNDHVSLTVGVDKSGTFKLQHLLDPVGGRKWVAETGADFAVTIRGMGPLAVGPSGLRYEGFTATELDRGVELTVSFTHAASRLRVTRHYACYAQVPVIETWTTFGTIPGAVRMILTDLNAWSLPLPRGTIRWVTGLFPGGGRRPFTVERKVLAVGERFEMGAQGRSSERAIPWFALESQGEELFGGLLWTGAWKLSAMAAPTRTTVTLGLGPMATDLRPGGSVEGPHAFFGIAPKAGPQTSESMRGFVEHALRGGRRFPSLLVQNTWYAHGTRLDEATIGRELLQSAELGAELFVMDAGWYQGAGAKDVYDFTSGLGRWRADEARFPSGLRMLSDMAHGLGMRFGLWVEPERVSLETVFNDEAVNESWLATNDGRYDTGLTNEEAVAGQLCLADPDARAWVIEQLARLIEEARPDYLKWDNNYWLNCNREGHGHGTEDGNFAHVRGLYEVLAALRERFPDLVIENCASGGNRLDLGMTRYTDIAWMDDQTSPAAHVRHNLEGLGTIFPPSYLLSFVLQDENEPLCEAADLPLYFRSRMPGVLGLGFLLETLREEDAEAAASELAIYKSLRDIQLDASLVPLTPQQGTDGLLWDAVQETSASSGEAIIFAFENDRQGGETRVRPVGLRVDAVYEVRSVDSGLLGTRTGAELMEEGIDLLPSTRSAAHILVLRVREARAPAPLADPRR